MNDDARPAAGEPPAVPGFVVGRLLGFGGHGEVWAATDERTGEQVALKLLAVPAGERERVLRESVLLRRIDHPHVLRTTGLVELPGDQVVLVLEQAPGGSLAALVGARGALDPGEVVTVLTPLAGALADLHARGLVHADVAPGNVLFAADGRPLLADLGVASLVGLDLSDRTARHGTAGYSDPALLGGAPAGPLSDVFGLAAVGWFALTGRPPQPSGSRPPLIPLAPDTPAELATLLERALDPQPHRRPGAAQFAVSSYQAAAASPVRLVPTDPGAAAGDVVTHRLRQRAAAEPPAEPEPPRSRRRLLLAAGVAAAVLVVGAAVAVGTGVLGSDPPPAAVEQQQPPSADQGPGATPTPEPTSEPAPTSAPDPTSDRTTDRPDPAGTPEVTEPPDGAATGADSTRQQLADDLGVPVEVVASLAADDPAEAVSGLAALRARAFATGQEQALVVANVAGSPALAGDQQLVAELAAQGLLLDGLTFDVQRTEVVTLGDGSAVVRVAVVTSEHRKVRADRSVAEDVPATGVEESVLELDRVAGRWQVRQVS